VNHVNLINACLEIFIKTIEKIITPTNIKTTKARILRTLSVRKISLLLNDENERKLIWKKSPISNRLWESNVRFEGLHLLTECELLKVLRFPLKAVRLLTYNNCTALYSTELRCKVLFCIAFSLFSSLPFFFYVCWTLLFSRLFLIVYQLFVSCRSILICILYYYYDFLQSVYRFFTSRKLFHYM